MAIGCWLSAIGKKKRLADSRQPTANPSGSKTEVGIPLTRRCLSIRLCRFDCSIWTELVTVATAHNPQQRHASGRKRETVRIREAIAAFSGASMVHQRSRTQSITSRRVWHEIRYHIIWRKHMPPVTSDTCQWLAGVGVSNPGQRAARRFVATWKLLSESQGLGRFLMIAPVFIACGSLVLYIFLDVSRYHTSGSSA